MAYTYYLQQALSGGNHTARLGVQVNSQSVVNNKSNITIKLQVRKDKTSSSWNMTGSALLWIRIDDVTKASKDTFDWRYYDIGVWHDQISWTGDITHGSDGKKNIKIDGYISTKVNAGDYNPTALTISLPTIARASVMGTPSIPTLEGAISVPITKYSSTFYDVLEIRVNNTLVKTVNNYISNASAALTDAEILIAYGTLTTMTPGVIFTLKTYTSSAKTTLVGSSTKSASPAIGGSMKVRVAGIWKNAIVYRRVSGLWKPCLAYRNVTNTWKRGV